ncbi:MAG: DUF420 domain-containing protein [Polyangiaceae bacterium]|nr:DUF420 domain-containing protein [Polyangiaceae bacterium]
MPSSLATLNAALNTAAAVCLVAGLVAIKAGKRERHRACMLSATGLSVAFLVSYLIHHARVGSVPFRGTGLVRTVYFVILIPHVVLAAALAPLVIVTLVQALRDRRPQHKRIARFTLPVWLFVSVSGVAVYVMLYHLPV